MTWSGTHIAYAFVNYIFAWFFCYNNQEIKSKKGYNLIVVSQKFLRILLILSFIFVPLKIATDKVCRNWNISWEGVIG